MGAGAVGEVLERVAIDSCRPRLHPSELSGRVVKFLRDPAREEYTAPWQRRSNRVLLIRLHDLHLRKCFAQTAQIVRVQVRRNKDSQHGPSSPTPYTLPPTPSDSRTAAHRRDRTDSTWSR